MKPRFTTWLLALLLVVTGAFSVPVVGIGAARTAQAIVCVDGERKTESTPARREVLQLGETVKFPDSPAIPTYRRDVAPRLTAHLAESLFQRPPPLSSCF